jgi:hypothetical protein
MRKDNPFGKEPKFGIDQNDFKDATFTQRFINKQLWASGGSYQTNATSAVQTPVKWGGQSRWLCGFNFYANNPTNHTISIILNQETIIDSVPLVFLMPLGNIRFIQYFEFIRPLSGSDTLVYNTISTTAETVSYGVYMTRAYNKYYSRD